jgi:D-alanyl-D-alanine dipeptidase
LRSRPEPVRCLLALISGGALLFGAHSMQGQRSSPASARHSPDAIPAEARQLVVVVTPGWSSITGTMRRFSRTERSDSWHQQGAEVPIVVGRTGLAWDARVSGGFAAGPRKREGDGRAPAGIFPLERAFGFAPAAEAAWIRLPYTQLTAGTECVDDTASAHYNQVVDRGNVQRVDWSSSERMREVGQYRLGVVVGYNTHPVRRSAGSCIFLHIWGGPRSPTVGCTAFDPQQLETLLRWLDEREHPVMVQLPAGEYAKRRTRWALP